MGHYSQNQKQLNKSSPKFLVGITKNYFCIFNLEFLGCLVP